MFSLTNHKSNNDNFLGQGSYGCVYYPGIDCKGKKNTKKTVTKVQEINFYSKNEKIIGFFIKKNIKNFLFCIKSFEVLKDSTNDMEQ